MATLNPTQTIDPQTPNNQNLVILDVEEGKVEEQEK